MVKDLSKSISFTWSKTTAKPNTWKQVVQLLFSLFEGQGLFFFPLSKRKLLNDSDVPLKVVRRAGVM